MNMEDITFDYSKLKGKIVEKFGTQGSFARANNLSNRAISLKLRNGISISQKEIVKWCRMLDIEPSEIPDFFYKLKVSKLKDR